MTDSRVPNDPALRAESGAGLLAVVGLVLGGTVWTVDAFMDSGSVVHAATPQPLAAEPAAVTCTPECGLDTLQPTPAWHVAHVTPAALQGPLSVPAPCPDDLSDCVEPEAPRRRPVRPGGGSSVYWSRVGAPVSATVSG